MEIPRSLFKFRTFDANSLRILCKSEVFYANPRSFSDPLDCDSTLNIDVDLVALERLCSELLKRSGSDTSPHKSLNELRYLSTEVGNYHSNPKPGSPDAIWAAQLQEAAG